jgi:hypothetical protein
MTKRKDILNDEKIKSKLLEIQKLPNNLWEIKNCQSKFLAFYFKLFAQTSFNKKHLVFETNAL